MIRVVLLQINLIKTSYNTKIGMFLHLHCTIIQDGKYAEIVAQGYRLRPVTPVIIKSKQHMTGQERYKR
jgi:hypothetical protein